MIKHKLAFIGSDRAARRAAKVLTRDKHIITAIYSESNNADRFALKYGAAVFESVDGLLKIGDFDCIYISSPQSLKDNQLLAVLQTGKSVLCESAVFTKTAKHNNTDYLKHENFRLVKSNCPSEFTKVVKKLKPDI